MLVLSCHDLGFDHCDFVATGDRASRVEAAFFAHARDAHPHFISGLSLEDRKEIKVAIDQAVAMRYCQERAQTLTD
jgi:predicted small metal-binding protein